MTDNVPTRVVAQNTNAQTARAYWFFLFHLVPDLLKTLISGKEAEWLHNFFTDWRYNIDTYIKAYKGSCAMRGAMSDYRANAEDVEQISSRAAIQSLFQSQ